MNKDIPEIDALLGCINNSGVNLDGLRNPPTETIDQPEEKKAVVIPATTIGTPESLDQFWQEVLDLLQNDSRPKNRSAYCRIERDLADTLDECSINGHCRTTLINAILRVAVKTFLPKLAEYRRESTSFFQPPKDTEP